MVNEKLFPVRFTRKFDTKITKLVQKYVTLFTEELKTVLVRDEQIDIQVKMFYKQHRNQYLKDRVKELPIGYEVHSHNLYGDIPFFQSLYLKHYLKKFRSDIWKELLKESSPPIIKTIVIDQQKLSTIQIQEILHLMKKATDIVEGRS